MMIKNNIEMSLNVIVCHSQSVILYKIENWVKGENPLAFLYFIGFD